MQYITIPNGKRVTLGQYCRAWKAIKTLAPDAEVMGWSAFNLRADVIRYQIWKGVEDRINRRGGITLREASDARILRHLRARVRPSCRWCGSQLDRYEPKHSRFCDASCRRSHSC